MSVIATHRLATSGCNRPPHPASHGLASRHGGRNARLQPPRCSPSTPEPSTSASAVAETTPPLPAPSNADAPSGKRRKADSTDAVASFLTRRFGLAGGLAWLGVLAVGSLGEQVKTRLEVAREEGAAQEVSEAAEVELPSGVRYSEERVGGGQAPARGMLVVLHYVGKANGRVFEDTRARGKPIVFVFGSRPYTGGMCEGLQQALATMRAGGRRRVFVPPQLGFGERGFVLRPTEHVPEKQGIIPPGSELEYDVSLERVSVPPS